MSKIKSTRFPKIKLRFIAFDDELGIVILTKEHHALMDHCRQLKEDIKTLKIKIKKYDASDSKDR